MVKAYLRYEPSAAFGVIASGDSNITYDSSGKHVLAPALEKINIWHVRQSLCIKTLEPTPPFPGPSLAVTSIASSPDSSLVASGHADGSIKIWDCDKGTCETTLSGHNGAVTALRYNKLGSLLASGSKDNDIILWDVVAETGLYRLRGHRDQVTDLVFLESGKKLVSSSKDKFLRVWDLDMSHPNEKGKKTPFQHCVQIVSGHHSEIWSVDVDPEEKYLVAGSADRELRFYTVKHESFVRESPFEVNETAKEDADQNKWEVLKPYGEIQRESKDRVATVRFNKSGNILACQAAGKTVDIFRVLDEVESKRKAKRRIHRKKEKKSLKGPEMIENGNADQKSSEDLGAFSVTVLDTFKHIHTLRAKLKICSIAFSPISLKNSLATMVLSMKNNSLEFYSVEKESSKRTVSIELQGHRTAVRSVTLSSDNTLLFSTSLNAVKVWNPSTGSCLRSIESGHGLCGIFGPLNKYALIGTKSGTIEIIDIGSGTRVETVEAHGGDVHSITPIPNQSGFVTGSADHDVKFWEYQVMQKPDHDTKCLTVSNVRTMKMNNDALAIVISPDSKYIAVALLDSTVKVYFMDSLKFFLSLYGHKLPVVCMDISSDGDLIVTGSLDKNLKIWGLDFGDCHKSIFAHADSVMAVKFVHNTHYLFSVGKDRLVKYWDADKFELLLTLEGHHDIVSGLAISNRGDFFITGSYDRSIRCWVRTEEPFFIEEEKEKRLEQMFESDLGNAFENKYAPQEEIPEEGAVALAGKKTQATLTATEAIEDALDLAEEEKARGEMAISQPNILLLGLSPSDYVLRAMSDVHVNDLEQTLLALPFSSALKLMSYLVEWTNNPDKVELVCRIATLLLQIHHNQLITTPAARELLTDLRKIIYDRVEECKDTIGFNLAAMDHLKQLMASKSDAPFRDANAKLQEIRSLLSKRVEERIVIKQERRKKKKQKTEF